MVVLKYSPGWRQHLLQWKGLQQTYTGSQADWQHGKRLSSLAWRNVGHRQAWQHSTCGWPSAGSSTHPEDSRPRASTAFSSISNCLSCSLSNNSSSGWRSVSVAVSSARRLWAFTSRLLWALRLPRNMNMKEDFPWTFPFSSQHLGATTVQLSRVDLLKNKYPNSTTDTQHWTHSVFSTGDLLLFCVRVVAIYHKNTTGQRMKGRNATLHAGTRTLLALQTTERTHGMTVVSAPTARVDRSRPLVGMATGAVVLCATGAHSEDISHSCVNNTIVDGIFLVLNRFCNFILYSEKYLKHLHIS